MMARLLHAHLQLRMERVWAKHVSKGNPSQGLQGLPGRAPSGRWLLAWRALLVQQSQRGSSVGCVNQMVT